ncbi:hypothetical protein C8Q76DRAFT_227085 [Earliella scabrosa]|nr:hypothetical protein C8Q76DRAFT_227085 [Earliella scabrosa]
MRATVTRYSAEAGPCPRDMIHLFRDKRLFYHNIEKALWSLADVHVAPLSFDLNKWSGTISPDEDTMRATVMRYSEEAVPCAREILGLLFGRRAFDAGIRRSPMRLDNLQPLFTPDRWTQTDYFSLIMIDRDGPIDVNNYCDDRMRIRLKTKGVSERLWRHSLQLRETTGTTFFSIVGQGTSILAGTAFMGIALRALSVNLHYSAMDNISGQFVRMSPSPPASQAFPHRFTYRPSTPTHLLSVEGITLELRAHRGLSLADEPLPSLPSPFVRRRECVQYKDLQEVYVNDSDFYVPSTHTNPPFDAFYFETSPEKVVLWVFQVTVQQAADRDTHTSSGFDLIVDLLAKVRDSPEHRNAQVEVKYVLVVPQSTEWAVEWNMAPEWEEVPGEVYIQFIDASVLASYCRPMDIVEYTQDG